MMWNNRIKRALEQIEYDAAVRARREAAEFESAQRDLCCPLPEQATPEEHDAALQLMIKAQRSQDRQRGWNAVRDYAITLHRKYGGPFADERLSDA